MPVSEDPDDVDTVVLDTERAERRVSGGRCRPARPGRLLTFSLLLLQPLSAPVDGRHLRLEAQVVLPDLLQLVLQEGDPLSAGHPVQLA